MYYFESMTIQKLSLSKKLCVSVLLDFLVIKQINKLSTLLLLMSSLVKLQGLQYKKN